jgi:lipopolysaccharide transport system ATP-binding protein
MTGHLKVNGLGKAYRTFGTEWARVLSWFGVPVSAAAEHWVLRDVSFEVRPGEAVAIIGHNGAGKSTLLKLITGTLRPSEGTVAVNGRVSAILELGMGFNPEFTARQNVRHSAGLMGFSAAQIDQMLPEVEGFAEIGEYFDQPMRTYSSGMQMRVAFAIATASRPDLLIVDEALSVGDSYFQHKSFDRIRRFSKEGTSLLFVSHSMGDVRALCNRAILLGEGRVLKDGLPDEVADYYNALVAAKESAKLAVEQQRDHQGWLKTSSGSGEAKVIHIQMYDAETAEAVKLARVGQRLRLTADVEISNPIPSLILGYMLRDRTGHVVWGTNTWHTEQRLETVEAGSAIRFDLVFTCTLGPGSYSFSPALVSTDTHLVDNYEWTDNAVVFDVINADRPMFIGSSYLDARFYLSVLKQG